MPEGQTEVERRYLKYGKKSIQMQKRNIFARIPLPTSLMLGHLPPRGRYMERYESARQTDIFYALGAVVSVGVVAEVPVLGILKPCTLPLAAVSVTSPPIISFLWTKSVA